MAEWHHITSRPCKTPAFIAVPSDSRSVLALATIPNSLGFQSNGVWILGELPVSTPDFFRNAHVIL